MDQTTALSPEYLAADKSSRLINVAIAFGVLESLFVALFYTSRWRSKTFRGWDTYIMLPAWLFAFSHVITDILFVRYGGDGRHVEAVSMGEVVTWLKLTTVESFTYVPSTTLPKLAILSFYQRIFVTKWHRNLAHVIFAILLLNWIVSLIINLVICVPFAYAWNKEIPGGHCMNQMQLYIWFSLPNLLTDLIILIMPLPAIWKLQMSKNQKIGVTITLLTGSFGIITAIVRLVVFINTNVFEDITWNGIEIMIWTTIEPGVYLIAACLPSLRSLIKDLFRYLDLNSIRSFFSTTRAKENTGDVEAYSLPKGTEWDRGFKRLGDLKVSSSFGDDSRINKFSSQREPRSIDSANDLKICNHMEAFRG